MTDDPSLDWTQTMQLLYIPLGFMFLIAAVVSMIGFAVTTVQLIPYIHESEWVAVRLSKTRRLRRVWAALSLVFITIIILIVVSITHNN